MVYFYSNQILKGVGIAEGVCTFIVQGASLFGVLAGMVQTGYFGRKRILFVYSVIMAAELVGLGLSLQGDTGTLPLLLVCAFVICFQASSGPVTWLYMAEIMQEKGLSIGTVLNWLFTLLMSFVTPTVGNAYGLEGLGYLFIIMGGCTAGCAAFIILFLRESKGKTLAERKALYSTASKVVD